MTATIAYHALDRYLIPSGRPELARYVAHTLLAAHGRFERWLPGARGAAWRVRPGAGEGDAAVALLNDARPALGVLGDVAADWVLVREAGSGRGRALAFGFARGERSPRAVLKLRRESVLGGSLEQEGEATRWACARLSDGSVPAVLGSAAAGGVEALLLAHVPGRSAYVELRNSLVPGRGVRAHLTAAAAWLARFHHASRTDRRAAPPRGVPAGDMPATSGVHGDFWARNVLHHGRQLAVVDWEHARCEGAGYEDLLHFALTYALAWPGRRPTPADALRLAFVEDTVMSRAVRDAARLYGAAVGIDEALWTPLLRDWLERGAPGPAAGQGPWAELSPLVGEAPCAFSG